MIPIVKATRWEYGLKFYCKYCKEIHRHGFGTGSRSAHCRKQTPYTETDYYLELEVEE